MTEVSATGAVVPGLAAKLVGRPVVIDRSTSPTVPAEPFRPLRPSDRVELSDRARYLAKLHEIPSVRLDLVGRVRAEIDAGSYDTPERFDAALDGLLEDADSLG